MNGGRCLLVTGLPAGLGASTFSMACADAIAAMGRRVALLSSLSSLPDLTGGLPARPFGSLYLFPRPSGGPDLIPIELADEQDLASGLRRVKAEYDMVVIDRFTGLNVQDSRWYGHADEIVVIVDGRPGQESRSLMLLGRIVRYWPDRDVSFLYNRVHSTLSWDAQLQRFLNRLETQFGFKPHCLGILPEAGELQRARRECRAFNRMYPNHPASRRLRQMARHLLLGDGQGTSQQYLPWTSASADKDLTETR